MCKRYPLQRNRKSPFSNRSTIRNGTGLELCGQRKLKKTDNIRVSTTETMGTSLGNCLDVYIYVYILYIYTYVEFSKRESEQSETWQIFLGSWLVCWCFFGDSFLMGRILKWLGLAWESTFNRWGFGYLGREPLGLGKLKLGVTCG
jgi:hypothetical protein